MKINEIKYSRVFNLGNYENETISVSASVDETDDSVAVLEQVKGLVTSGRKLPTPIKEVVNHAPNAPKNSPADISAASKPKDIPEGILEYEIKMGKFKGRKFKSFATDEISKLDSYVKWLCDDASEKGKNLNGPAKELVEKYNIFRGPNLDTSEKLPF